ncbi:protein disulfide oxidoreductase [Motilimonas pumila]|uniref:Protein disulfide oxidoreductase n=1 Tax=Motilimonas pumila TaxID=2303987 RepID=A0A418YIJ9_9GAMM|nr:protein disulfide oxidoreductase [Motilimonas pumila]RJG50442.1 protein disulfide oxidoreductase [Motilimonas pumila]
MKLNKWRKWTGQGVSFLLLLFIISSVADWWRGRDLIHQPIPDITVYDIEGKAINLAQLSQQQAPTLIYFWGTWCPVCNYVSPAVSWLSQHYQIVSVALRSGEPDRVRQYLEHHDYEFNTINDPQNRLGAAWGIRVTPTLVVIKDGKIQYYTTGFTSLPGIWWRLWLA